MTKKEKEREEARERLRKILKPGDTVYTICRRVSRSGMLRLIDCYSKDFVWITALVAKATDTPLDKKTRALRVTGTGMDMGWAVVFDLTYCLWPNGYPCKGKDSFPPVCFSPDHSPTSPTKGRIHKDEYALNREWL